MGRIEKAYLLVYCLAILAYVPCFILFVEEIHQSRIAFRFLITTHFTLMFMGLIMLILILRDLYKRAYMSANQKLTWGLWVTLFSLSIIVYYFKHARHPRDVSPTPSTNNPSVQC